MPNKQDIKKRYLSFLTTRTLFYQLTQAAAEKGVTRSTLVNDVLDHEFGHIELTDENRQKIKAETLKAKKRREYL